MNNTEEKITEKLLDDWATNMNGPVALHLKQKLLSVEMLNEDDRCIIYPPTYADIGYNIDTLSDGTRVALIDSVGSQANRLEPIFKSTEDDSKKWIVPQIDIVIRTEDCGECDICKKENRTKNDNCKSPRKEKRSLLDLAHRIADAVVRSSTGLMRDVELAFKTLKDTGDAEPLCKLAPTSLVFGVWDSRNSGEKRPRLVRSIIRAWDVDPLHAAAQFNSIWKTLDEESKKVLDDEAKKQKKKLSVVGFADAPSTFRDTKIPQYRNDGLPNPEARVLGGVLVNDRIERDVTVNLVALRGLRGNDENETTHIRKYLLGLSLIAATADIELFLREGCNLRYSGDDKWYAIPRRGKPEILNLDSADAKKLIEEYTEKAASHFREKWRPKKELEFTFDHSEAKKLLKKKPKDDTENK